MPTLYNILIYLLIAAVGLFLFRTFFDTMIGKEGFAQLEKFVLKKDSDTYDEFYAQIYDSIHLPDPEKELDEILKIVRPDKHSVFLDVGCGTGCTLNALTKSGAKCMGIENSDAMIQVAKRKHGNELSCKRRCYEPDCVREKSIHSHSLS